MGLLTGYAGYEVRKWFRDAMSPFMLFYFLLIGLAGRFLVPLVEDQLGFNLAPWYHTILVVMALITPRVMGAVAGFSILDDRDDNILLAVKVAPMTMEQFIGVKLGLVYAISVLGSAFVIWFANLTVLPAGVLWGIAALAGFGAPMMALLINCFASNKIEGFAAIKGLNVLIIIPAVALSVGGWTEFVFAFEPGFWPAKALSLAVQGREAYQLTYAGYYWIGLAWTIVVNLLVYRVFKRRV